MRPTPRVRLGIHTGPVVIDPRTPIKERRNLALGNTPNVAARLQQLAEPNTILLSGDTRRLLHTNPKLRDLGDHTLKGLQRPVRVHRVVAGDAQQHVPLGARRFSPSPMVNRTHEITALTAGWAQVRTGSGYAALIEGDAGVGKSRLARHVISTLEQDADVLVGNCSALRTASALFPIAQMLRATLSASEVASPDEQLVQLDAEIQRLGLEDAHRAGLAASLRLPIDDPWFESASPELRRKRTHDALHQWTRARARARPVVLMIEDLHWSDPSTLEWLGELLDHIAEQPLLVLLTSRLGQDETPNDALLERLTISGLTQQHAEELIHGVAGANPISDVWRDRLLAETDGVPLYLEEMTRGVLEAQDQPWPAAGDQAALGIPNSLQALLTSRLDRLRSSKPLAQWASVLGRTFSMALLRAVTTTPPHAFEGEFTALVHAGIVEPDAPSEDRFRFRHALFQEAAYRSLLRTERRERHHVVARALVEGASGVTPGADEIAHHYDEAGLAVEAAGWWLKAGDEALARSENAESVAFLRRGLAAVQSQGGDETQSLRLHLEASLATALTAAQGYAAAEIEVLHGSVRIRARRLGDSREIFSSVRHTLPFYLVRAQHARAHTLGKELVDMASRLDDPSLVMEAHLALATACFWLSEAAASRRHANEALTRYEPRHHQTHAVEFGQDPGTLGHLYAAWSNWWLGAFDTARRHLADGLALARERNHPHSLAMALDHGCSLHLYFQEWDEARALAREQLEISGRYGFSMWAAMAGFRNAWLDGLAGDLDGCIARMEGAMRAFRATGAEIARPLHLSYLAHAHWLAGNGEAGLAVVAEALEAASDNGEQHYIAEIHRLTGHLAIQTEGVASPRARDAFRTAITTAQQQGGRALELRAALSWYQVAPSYDQDTARDGLIRVVGTLEGAGDAPDLMAAREALGERPKE